MIVNSFCSTHLLWIPHRIPWNPIYQPWGPLSSSSRKWYVFQHPVLITKTVKNFEESEILLNIKANKLGSHHFTEAGKRHPYVRKKVQFIPHSNNVARVPSFASCPQTSVSKGDVKKVHAMGCLTERKPKHREPRPFKAGSKHVCPFPQRKTLSLPYQ